MWITPGATTPDAVLSLSLQRGRNSMSTSTTQPEKDTESSDTQERADTASDAFVVGVDQNGQEHVFSCIRDRVTVRDGDEHDTQRLDGRPLSEWMSFIEQECGWRETNVYSGSTVQHLADQLATAVNGGETQ
jgi:hypothetical protein